VTGGSSGIGLSVALEAARQGAHVSVIARNQEKLSEAGDSILQATRDPTMQKITTLSSTYIFFTFTDPLVQNFRLLASLQTISW